MTTAWNPKRPEKVSLHTHTHSHWRRRRRRRRQHSLSSPRPSSTLELPHSPLAKIRDRNILFPSPSLSSSDISPRSTNHPFSPPFSPLGENVNTPSPLSLPPPMTPPSFQYMQNPAPVLDYSFSEQAYLSPRVEIIKESRIGQHYEMTLQLVKPKCKKLRRSQSGLSCRICNCETTPEWRRGPDGLKSLCNACGLRFAQILKKEQLQPPKQPDVTKLRIESILNTQ